MVRWVRGSIGRRGGVGMVIGALVVAELENRVACGLVLSLVSLL